MLFHHLDENLCLVHFYDHKYRCACQSLLEDCFQDELYHHHLFLKLYHITESHLEDKFLYDDLLLLPTESHQVQHEVYHHCAHLGHQKAGLTQMVCIGCL